MCRYKISPSKPTANMNIRSAPKATFDVIIGDEGKQEIFTLDRHTFCARSETLKAMLEHVEAGSSVPGNPQLVVIDYFDAEDFETYKSCVDAGEIVLPEDEHNSFAPLIRLYVVAYRLCDFTIANLAIEDIMRLSNKLDILPNNTEISNVWEALRRTQNPLKRLFVDYQIHEAGRRSLKFKEGDVPFRYLVDVAMKYAALVEAKGPRGEAEQDDDVFKVKCSSRPRCHYHLHDDKDGFHAPCA